MTLQMVQKKEEEKEKEKNMFLDSACGCCKQEKNHIS